MSRHATSYARRVCRISSEFLRSVTVVDIFRLCQISEDSVQTSHDYFTDVRKMVVVVLSSPPVMSGKQMILVCDVSSQNVFCCEIFCLFLSDRFFCYYSFSLLAVP